MSSVASISASLGSPNGSSGISSNGSGDLFKKLLNSADNTSGHPKHHHTHKAQTPPDPHAAELLLSLMTQGM